jgi:hypothetical protein
MRFSNVVHFIVSSFLAKLPTQTLDAERPECTSITGSSKIFRSSKDLAYGDPNVLIRSKCPKVGGDKSKRKNSDDATSATLSTTSLTVT